MLLPHHGLGPEGGKALAKALVVRTFVSKPLVTFSRISFFQLTMTLLLVVMMMKNDYDDRSDGGPR